MMRGQNACVMQLFQFTELEVAVVLGPARGHFACNAVTWLAAVANPKLTLCL